MNTRTIANGLGWFSIALGATELAFARSLGSALGIERPGLIRLFGAREIASGFGVLLGNRKGPGIWARIVGDALDMAVLASAAVRHASRRRNTAIAAAAVLPVVVLDLVCGRRLGLAD